MSGEQKISIVVLVNKYKKTHKVVWPLMESKTKTKKRNVYV